MTSYFSTLWNQHTHWLLPTIPNHQKPRIREIDTNFGPWVDQYIFVNGGIVAHRTNYRNVSLIIIDTSWCYPTKITIKQWLRSQPIRGCLQLCLRTLKQNIFQMAPSSEKRSFLSRDFGDISDSNWSMIMENERHTNVMLNIRYRYLALLTIICAGASFIFCIVYSFIFHFDEVTSTHCNVWNVAPSISCKFQGYSNWG